MKRTGIWLDKKKALIVEINQEKEAMKIIYSDIENFNVTANKHKGGAQEIVKDRKFLEREKNQFKTYFKDIAAEIDDTDALVIFGPAKTYEKFAKELNDNHVELSSKIKGVSKVDSMTDNQVKAWVRDFFKADLITLIR